jgi:hypothetical protein
MGAIPSVSPLHQRSSSRQCQDHSMKVCSSTMFHAVYPLVHTSSRLIFHTSHTHLYSARFSPLSVDRELQAFLTAKTTSIPDIHKLMNLICTSVVHLSSDNERQAFQRLFVKYSGYMYTKTAADMILQGIIDNRNDQFK